MYMPFWWPVDFYRIYGFGLPFCEHNHNFAVRTLLVDFGNVQKDANSPSTSLVGNLHQHNFHKIELGIDLNEPISISRAEFVPRKSAAIKDSDRPYQHDFAWYEDYYDNIGDKLAEVLYNAHSIHFKTLKHVFWCLTRDFEKNLLRMPTTKW